MSRRKWLLLWIVLSLLSFALAVKAQMTPAELQKKLEEAIQMGQQIQQEADAWGKEKERLTAEIRNLKNRKKWLEYQLEKHETYLQNQKDVIAKLEGKRRKVEEIRMALEPYLDEVVKRLEKFVQSDLKFLPEERRKRLDFLKDSLGEYHLGLSEKLRRVLEALQVEAEYGKTLEKTETSLQLEGKTTQVYLLRFGRVALFYLSLDGKRLGRLNRETGQWETLPYEVVGDLTLAMEMAERKRAMELVDLPIGREWME